MLKLWTVKALAELFEKDEETIRRWIKDGDVFPSAFQLKGGWYVKQADVDRITDGPADPGPTPRRPSKRFVRDW